MKNQKSWGAFAAGTVLVGATLVGMPSLYNFATQGSEQLSFANSYTLDHPHNACGTALVQQDMNDVDVQIYTYPSSQLGGDADRFTSMMNGDIDIDLQGSSALASVHEPIGVLDMAYVFDGPDHLFRWFDSDESDEVIGEFEEETGVKVLDIWYQGDRTFSANQPIREPADLDGLRIRYPGSPAHLMSADAMGVEPVAVAVEEVYMALQQGIADGQENPIAFTAQNSLDEVVDYVSLSRHAVGSQLVVVADETWERLSAEQQEQLHISVTQTRSENRTCAEAEEEEVLTRWAEQGSPVVVDDVDREAFREQTLEYLENNLSDGELETLESIRSVAVES